MKYPDLGYPILGFIFTLQVMTKSMFNPSYEYFRKLLVQARKSLGLTQIEVAERLGKPQSFVSKYECGERRLDVIEFLEVANILNIDAPLLINEIREVMRGGDHGSSS